MNTRANLGIVTICGSLLLGLPLFAPIATAQPVAARSSSNNIKELCLTNASRPASAASANTQNRGQTVSESTSATRSEQQTRVNVAPRPAITSMNVTLVNKTNALVCYQALQHTRPRQLVGQSKVMLGDLPAPLTVTFYRQDGGLLQVNERKTEEGLILTLTEARTLTADRQTLVVDENGTYQLF